MINDLMTTFWVRRLVNLTKAGVRGLVNLTKVGVRKLDLS